ncbi:AMP-binding protein [Jatrophihabitans sp. GAS493]|uniref:AMP-binding protein n=1 Tax=Jatrophihabitans sp. GAS493 TaxID=1907575 RepID=UPI0018D58598|nr:AMP-binding protein [Jatrophihabitans sp. GAS493]
MRRLLEQRAAEAPNEIFAIMEQTGEQWSRAETLQRTRAWASALQSLGVGQGDIVGVWLPNGPAALLAYLSITYLGAVYTPFNTGYKAGVLEHVVNNSGARVLIADSRLVDRLDSIERDKLTTLIVVGPQTHTPSGVTVLSDAVLHSGDPLALKDPERPIEPWDPLAIIYTSGTTGPSKGAIASYLLNYLSVLGIPSRPGHRLMLVGPMFHMSGTGIVYNALLNRGSIVMLEAFSTQTFWRDVRRFGITSGTLLGAMTTFLLKEPPGPADRDHTLEQVLMVPLSNDSEEFTRRFGVDVITCYNMTEISTPLVSEVNPRIRGTAGRLRPEFDARIVDSNDIELPDGVAGEVILRCAVPWALSTAYLGSPEASARAWRNGWFHTGDAMRRDAEGNYFFVDRLKDAIRRRGENISSFEVEKEILAHPNVRDAAVVPVPSEFGEDDVLAVVTSTAGATIDPADLIRFLQPRLAHFMIPRYVRVVDELPVTPTNKVEKYRLRAEGVTRQTWDRDKTGLVIKRERLSSAPHP